MRSVRFAFIAVLLNISLLFAQQQYYNEQYRPQFHFSPETKWMNDPNGLVYFNGQFNLFYQYYPGDIVWGPMHWGHAGSKDLFHWNHYPIALYPDSLGNIFSGSAVIDKNNSAGFGKDVMIAVFTYHNDSLWARGFKNTESQGIAYSLDGGLTFRKFEHNPVLNNSGQQDFRDPKVFWNDEIKLWNLVLAAGDKIKIYSSPDLKTWTFESDFKPANDYENLGVWECPDLFKMKYSDTEKWILIVNHGDKAPNGGSGTRYFVGSFDGKTFKNEQPSEWLDYGTDFYAAVTFSNVPDDKRILIAWMSNWQYATKTPTYTWRSAMTLPRELELDKDANRYFLIQKIVEEFDQLKTKTETTEQVNLPFTQYEADLSQAEIYFECDAQNITVEIANKKGETFKIELKDNILSTDRRSSGQTGFSDKFAADIQKMTVEEKAKNFRIILDRASAEILLNDGKYSMTNIFFPSEPFSELKIYSRDSSGLKHLTISKIKRVWKNNSTE